MNRAPTSTDEEGDDVNKNKKHKSKATSSTQEQDPAIEDRRDTPPENPATSIDNMSGT